VTLVSAHQAVVAIATDFARLQKGRKRKGMPTLRTDAKRDLAAEELIGYDKAQTVWMVSRG
jgi:hypothetical protein